jgi:proteasome lid subunit RPN8/RPN11
MNKIIRAFSGRTARLRLGRKQWQEMISELAERGAGERESGAFLIASRLGDGKTIKKVAYLDDLDPNCLIGGIHFHREGYAKLSALCNDVNGRVIADVHTHPGSWVGQSATDQSNPMISRPGHIALVVPRYAEGRCLPEGVGFHEYRGCDGWQSITGKKVRDLIYVGRWP